MDQNHSGNFFLAVLHMFLNIAFLILGMSILGLGLATESTVLSGLMFTGSDASELTSKIGSTAVISGVIILVASTLNCCFVMDGTSVFYYVYAGALILVFILLTCLLAIYGIEMENTVELQVKELMQKRIKYDEDGSGETRLDGIQEALHCCGISSYNDWLKNPDDAVPVSCCVKFACQTGKHNNIFQEGCATVVMSVVTPLLNSLTAIGITITVLLPFQIILVIFMARHETCEHSILYGTT